MKEGKEKSLKDKQVTLLKIRQTARKPVQQTDRRKKLEKYESNKEKNNSYFYFLNKKS